MLWRVAAEIVLVVHLTFVVYVVVGGFLAWRWPRSALVHAPVAVYGAVIQIVGFTCPLTPLERWLRRRARVGGYDTGFVEHYLVSVLYPGDFTFTVRLVLAGLVVVLNLLAYCGLWWLLRQRRRTRERDEQRDGSEERRLIEETPTHMI